MNGNCWKIDQIFGKRFSPGSDIITKGKEGLKSVYEREKKVSPIVRLTLWSIPVMWVVYSIWQYTESVYFKASDRATMHYLFAITTIATVMLVSGIALCLVITATKIYREKTESAEKYFSAIIESSADAIVSFDNNGIIRLWNKGAEEIFGYMADEMIGKPIHTMVPERQRKEGELTNLFHEVYVNGFVKDYQTERMTKYGKIIMVNLTRTAIRDKDGKITGYSSIMRDVTEKTRLESKLKESENLASIGELAAGLAHEIRNPLAGIDNLSGMLEQDLETEQREIIREIRVQIGRMDKIVDDLLRCVRRPRPELINYDINSLLEESISIVQHGAGKNNIRVIKDMDGSIPMVMIDPRLLGKAFTNLMINGFHAMDEVEGILTISSSQKGKNIFINIKDTGKGISRDNMKKIFSPFFTTKRSGTGIGLSVTKRVIEAHQGEISVESEPGKGTTFIVSLPKLMKGENILC
ncbi:PAS domain S-box protein [bacterium]|nr:PAS domain S-box protein [bacterium]